MICHYRHLHRQASDGELAHLFLHNIRRTMFGQIGGIGKGIVDSCELDFTEVLKKIKSSSTITVSEQNFEDIKNIL